MIARFLLWPTGALLILAGWIAATATFNPNFTPAASDAAAFGGLALIVAGAVAWVVSVVSLRRAA